MIWWISCSDSSNRVQEKNPASVIARVQKFVLFNIRSCVIAREYLSTKQKSILHMENGGQYAKSDVTPLDLKLLYPL